MKTLADAPFLDIFSAEFQADPGPVVENLRAQSWLLQTPIGGMVVEREKVQSLLADRRLRSAVNDLAMMQGVTDGPLADRMNTSVLALEGEDHMRIRRLVNRAFTPRAVDPHRPMMRATLARLLDPIAGRGECEFVTEIADHYPISVMCHVLGIPEEDHETFTEWNKAITWMLSFSLAEHIEEATWGMTCMSDYVSQLVADRRAEPREDMVTALVQAREADDRLTDDEINSMLAALLFAGYDTTRNQLGLAMWLFSEFPEQWRILRAQPDLAGRAVEEIMRYRGAVGAVPRIVAEEFELDGYRLPAGTIITLSTSAANFDPTVFNEPFDFDITVEREPQLTFGGGPHYCLGANLARAEMQEALPMLAAAMPDVALAGEPEWRPPMGIFGPERLLLRWGAT